MKSSLAIQARDIITWRESKTAVLAALMLVLGVASLEVTETDRGLTIDMSLTRAVKSMETIIKYFTKHYEGLPVSLAIVVRQSNENA
jgi:hypothetical protein